MPDAVQYLILSLCLFYLASGRAIPPLYAQIDTATDVNAPAYLFRMERHLRDTDVCALVRGDGQYHVERLAGEKADIFEGVLALADRQKLKRLLGADELFQLTQEKIVMPMITVDNDKLLLSVLRPGYWQNLTLPDSESRKPFQQSLVPLVKWLEEMEKQKHVRLTEEGARNNCLPPGKIELKTRNRSASVTSTSTETEATATKQPVLISYALRAVINRLGNQQIERTCMIVYSAGRYHLERKRQRFGSRDVKIQIFEDSISDTQLQLLREILDTPTLRNKPYEEPPARIPVDGAQVTSLTIPRAGHIQKVNIWEYLNVPRLGSIGTLKRADNGANLLKPLNKWLTSNIQESKISPLQAAVPSDCEPSGSSP